MSTFNCGYDVFAAGCNGDTTGNQVYCTSVYKTIPKGKKCQQAAMSDATANITEYGNNFLIKVCDSYVPNTTNCNAKSVSYHNYVSTWSAPFIEKKVHD